jgi:hypothetical protein
VSDDADGKNDNVSRVRNCNVELGLNLQLWDGDHKAGLGADALRCSVDWKRLRNWRGVFLSFCAETQVSESCYLLGLGHPLVFFS